MVIIRTSAEEVSIHAVSPESIFGASAANAGVTKSVAQLAISAVANFHPPLEGGSKFALREFRGGVSLERSAPDPSPKNSSRRASLRRSNFVGPSSRGGRFVALIPYVFILFPFDWIF